MRQDRRRDPRRRRVADARRVARRRRGPVADAEGEARDRPEEVVVAVGVVDADEVALEGGAEGPAEGAGGDGRGQPLGVPPDEARRAARRRVRPEAPPRRVAEARRETQPGIVTPGVRAGGGRRLTRPPSGAERVPSRTDEGGRGVVRSDPIDSPRSLPPCDGVPGLTCALCTSAIAGPHQSTPTHQGGRGLGPSPPVDDHYRRDDGSGSHLRLRPLPFLG